MPVPSDFDIRRPSAAWIVEWMYTSVNGMSPANSMPVKIIRATQRLMMSRAGDEHVARVPAPQRRRVVGPAERRERPQRRREPRVEDVGGLLPAVALGPVGLHHVRAVGREPHGQAMAPPQLARDAPGPDRLHPVEEDLLEPLRMERDAPAADGVHRRWRRAPPSCRTTAATRSARRARRSAGRSRPSGAAAPRRRSGPSARSWASAASWPCSSESPVPLRLQVAQPALLVHEQQRRRGRGRGRSRSRSGRGPASPSGRPCRSPARRARRPRSAPAGRPAG